MAFVSLSTIFSISALSLTALASPPGHHYNGGGDRPPWQQPTTTAAVVPQPATSVVGVPPPDTSVVVVGGPVPSVTPVGSVSYPPTQPSQPVPSSQPSGTNPSNTCGSGGGGLQIQWTGLEVSYSWSGGSGKTTKGTCLDLTGFQGQVALGGAGGSIIETNPSNYFDVSYILGYSVPIVCSGGGAVTGCNKDLLGNGGKEGQVRKNPTGPGGTKDPGSYAGAADKTPWCYACSVIDPFFQPCAGSAYSYPYDDGASVGPSTDVTCCVGTDCPSTGREGSTAGGHPEMSRDPPCNYCAGTGSGGTKRGLQELLEGVEGANATEVVAEQGGRKRKHKRHGSAHGNPWSPVLPAGS